MYMSDDIERIIEDVNFEDFCNPRQGDCQPVALALAKVFDADFIVSVYEPGENKYATHATVQINGCLYDGNGKTSREILIDFVDDIKMKNFPSDVNTRDEKIDYIENELIIKMPVENLGWEPPEEYVERIRESKEKVIE